MQSQPESLNTSLNHIHSAAQTRFTQPFHTPITSQNYVPFLIKSNRFHQHKTQAAIPPIGSYNLPSCFDRKKSPFEDRISHFLLQSVKKKQQMCIFKSSMTRFNKINSSVPGPASYNLFLKESEHKPSKPKIQQHRENLIELLKTCPSIPHKGNKYGYAVVNGNMKNIEKTLDQLQKEKQSRKHYVSTLEGEPTFTHQDTLHRNYHDADYRKKLYEETQKVVNKQVSYTEDETHAMSQRKPKYEHLYHSKGVPVENSHKLLGPGQYDIARKVFSPSGRKEKYQFFGSTEVRFKERTNQEEKGYTLIEMIKENNRKSTGDMLRDRRTPLKKKLHTPTLKQQLTKKLSNPGPGDYNPQDDFSKKTRGTAFFPQEERFKQKSAEPHTETYDEELMMLSRTQSKKMPNTGNLKKDRFKPIHKVYDPVRSQQICGILSEKGDNQCDKQNQNGSKKGIRCSKKRQTKSKMSQNQQISCWSRGEKREKSKAGGYIKQLKEELAIINYTPGPEEIIKKHSSNKYTLQSECTE